MDIFIQMIKYVRIKQVLTLFYFTKCRKLNKIPFFTKHYMVSDSFLHPMSEDFKQNIIETYFIKNEPKTIQFFKNYYNYLKKDHFHISEYANTLSQFIKSSNIISFNYYNASNLKLLHSRELRDHKDVDDNGETPETHKTPETETTTENSKVDAGEPMQD